MRKPKSLFPATESSTGANTFIPNREVSEKTGEPSFIQPTVQQKLEQGTSNDPQEQEAEQMADTITSGETVSKSEITTSGSPSIQQSPDEEQGDFSLAEGELLAADNEQYIYLSEYISPPGKHAFSSYDELLAFASMKAQNVRLSEGIDYWSSDGTDGVAVLRLEEGQGFADEGKVIVCSHGRYLLAHIYRRGTSGGSTALHASGGVGDLHDVGRIFMERNALLTALLTVDGRIYHMSSYERSISEPEATDTDSFYDMVGDYRNGDLELTAQEARTMYNAMIKSQALSMLSDAYVSLEETEALLAEQPAEEMAEYLRTMKENEVEFDIWISLMEEVEADMDSQVSILDYTGVKEVMVLNMLDGTRQPAHYLTAREQVKRAKSGIESQRAAYRSGIIDKNPLSKMLGPMLYHVDPDDFADDASLQGEMVSKVSELKIKVKTFEKEVVKGSVDPQDLASAVAEVHQQLDIRSTGEFAVSMDQMDEFSQRAEEAGYRHVEGGMAYSLGMTAVGATVGAFNPVLGALIFMGEVGGSAMELKSAYDLYQLSGGYYDKASAVVDPDAAWNQFLMQSVMFALELALEAFPLGLDMYNTYKVNQWSNIADVAGAIDVPSGVAPPVNAPQTPTSQYPRTRGDELADSLGYPELPNREDYMWVKGPKDKPYVRRRNPDATQIHYNVEGQSFRTGPPNSRAQRHKRGPHRPEIIRPENQTTYRALSEETAGTGGIDSITGYKNADGEVVVQAEGHVQDSIGRSGFERKQARNVGEVGLDGYENAHLWGAGFGDEARAGIMYAPIEVNQVLQRLGIERTIRELRDLGHKVHLKATAVGYNKTEMGDLGFRLQRGEEVLKSVRYEVSVVHPHTGKNVSIMDVEIHIGRPPAGRVETPTVRMGSGYRDLDTMPTE